MLNLVSRMGQVAAGTQDGGFWENVLETIPKLRGYATVDASDDQLYSLRIQDTYQHNGQTRVASYYKVDGAGRKQGQTVELRNLSGFSRQAANLIELMLLDGAREDFGI